MKTNNLPREFTHFPCNMWVWMMNRFALWPKNCSPCFPTLSRVSHNWLQAEKRLVSIKLTPAQIPKSALALYGFVGSICHSFSLFFFFFLYFLFFFFAYPPLFGRWQKRNVAKFAPSKFKMKSIRNTHEFLMSFVFRVALLFMGAPIYAYISYA